MKRIAISLMLLCACFIVLAGCGGSSKKSSDNEEKETEKVVLRAVTNAEYAPFEYRDKDQIVGFDVDLLNAIAKQAGFEVKIEHVGWDPMFIELSSKRAQIGVGAVTINDKRKESYDFSKPYFLATQKILVPEGSSIKSAEDLKGKMVAVQSGTTGMIAVEKILGTNNKNIKKYEDSSIAIMDLIKGGADAVVADNAVVEEYAKNNPDKKLAVVEDKDSFESEFYGLMYPKGEAEIKKQIDNALIALYDNGEYTEIYQKWFGNDPDIDFLKKQQ